jgi:hypothetical protein
VSYRINKEFPTIDELKKEGRYTKEWLYTYLREVIDLEEEIKNLRGEYAYNHFNIEMEETKEDDK